MIAPPSILVLLALAMDPSAIWDRQFPAASGVSWLLMDTRTRTVVSRRWTDAARGAAPGSLVKPFLAAAYGWANQGRFPEIDCQPGKCWLPRGHGRTGLKKAIEHSCNEYARTMRDHLDLAAFAAGLAPFGLTPPASRNAWTGESRGWRVAPEALAIAYAELAARRADPVMARILEGLRAAAESGTAAAAGPGVFAKTGTAPCLDASPHDGDGLAVIVAPRDNPQFVLLVRQHNVPGSRAAETAHRMMRSLREAP